MDESNESGEGRASALIAQCPRIVASPLDMYLLLRGGVLGPQPHARAMQRMPERAPLAELGL